MRTSIIIVGCCAGLLHGACSSGETEASGTETTDSTGPSSTGQAAGGSGAASTGSASGGNGANGPGSGGSTGGNASNSGGSASGGSSSGGSASGGSGSGGNASGGSGSASGGNGSGGSASGGSGGSSGVNSTPCEAGTGWALWRLSWDSNSAGYADVDAWDNGCAYSLADQACSLSGEPHDYADFGPGVEFDSSQDFFRVRFSVQGLSFTTATLHISAHADAGGIPNGILDSPIYGSTNLVPTVPISQHRHYAVDWTNFLSPTDQPSLTAVTLRSMPIGLAVSKMELCVE